MLIVELCGNLTTCVIGQDSAGLTIVLVVPWEGPLPHHQRAPTNCQFFTTLF